MVVCVRNENLETLDRLKKLEKLNDNLHGLGNLPFLELIEKIMKIIKTARMGRYHVIKIKYSTIDSSLPIESDLAYVTNVNIIYFYYRLLSCMVNNFNELFDDPNDINILLKYCIRIKKFFKILKSFNIANLKSFKITKEMNSPNSVTNIENMNNNINEKKNLNFKTLNSTNCVGATNKNKRLSIFQRTNKINLCKMKSKSISLSNIMLK